MSDSPKVVVLAGPNGAGKSTSARRLVYESLQITEFVNADVIARGLSGFAPESASVRAGKIMLNRLNELSKSRINFAFETTLSGRTFAPWLQGIIRQGYSMHLFFLWLSTPELAMERVSQRVRKGGHAISEETVRRRYFNGLRNLVELYQPLAAHWQVVDNSIGNRPTCVAEGSLQSVPTVLCDERWKAFMTMQMPPPQVTLTEHLLSPPHLELVLAGGALDALRENQRFGLPFVTERQGRLVQSDAREAEAELLKVYPSLATTSSGSMLISGR